MAALRLPNGEILRLALGSLLAHKLRGGLTILGIVIGITSVVSMVSLVEGLNRSMRTQLASLGSDTIRISRYDPALVIGDLPDSLRNRRPFERADARGIRENCPSVGGVTVSKDSRERLHYRGEESRRTRITGIDGDYLRVHSLALDGGRGFTDPEVRGGARVALIGADVVEQLFSGIDPVGETFLVGHQKFEVVGLLGSRGKFLGRSLDNRVLIPLAAMERYFAGPGTPLEISARAVSSEAMLAAREEIVESLRRTRGLRPADGNDFALVTQDNLLSLYKSITGAFFLVVVAIASVALLVGGIGVMNIMLVSVTERTREIGIRKALGARRRQILTQFLAEAVVLTATGGGLGIALGLLFGFAVNRLSSFPSYVPLWAYVAAVSVSVGVGLFFGFWPAVRASRLDPVEALGRE